MSRLGVERLACSRSTGAAHDSPTARLWPDLLVGSTLRCVPGSLGLTVDSLCEPSVLRDVLGDRLERIGGLSEKVDKPIEIYEPYTSGLQDEKTYKVVKDRARWFSIVMGDDGELDEANTDLIADRVPMPDDLIARLTLNLGVQAASGTDTTK